MSGAAAGQRRAWRAERERCWAMRPSLRLLPLLCSSHLPSQAAAAPAAPPQHQPRDVRGRAVHSGHAAPRLRALQRCCQCAGHRGAAEPRRRAAAARSRRGRVAAGCSERCTVACAALKGHVSVRCRPAGIPGTHATLRQGVRDLLTLLQGHKESSAGAWRWLGEARQSCATDRHVLVPQLPRRRLRRRARPMHGSQPTTTTCCRPLRRRSSRAVSAPRALRIAQITTLTLVHHL